MFTMAGLSKLVRKSPAAKRGMYCHNSFGSMLAWLKNFNWTCSEKVMVFVLFSLSLSFCHLHNECVDFRLL